MKLLKQLDIDKVIQSISKQIKKNRVSSFAMTLCLASKSPRRRECLKTIIPEFNTDFVSDKEESVLFKDMKDIAHYLALQKQKIFLEKRPDNQDRFIITSDTIVYYPKEKKLLGKPDNLKQAEEMLRYHFGKQHTVASVLVISDRHKEKLYSIIDTAVVRFKPYTENLEPVIQHYLRLEPPYGSLDKAGAYGIQEDEIKTHLLESVEGDIYTVIGFPLIKFQKFWDELLIELSI